MSAGECVLADEGDAAALGTALAAELRPGDAVALSGPLGAGKTTLARAILRGLGLAGEAPSPSFAIVIAYDPPELRMPVWHVDLYRLDEPDDLVELGLDDARRDAVMLIEWPERMGDRLWPDTLRLALAPTAEGGRRLTWTAPAAWDGRWLPSPRR